MNQILITKKLYVTPELKRKKKMYKFDFILSAFLVLILMSFYIYAEYDRNKSEEVSQGILENVDIGEDPTVAKSDILIAVLNDNDGTATRDLEQKQQEEQQRLLEERNNEINNSNQEVQNVGGYEYIVDSKIYIPALGIEYPVFLGVTGSANETENLLKYSPCKFHGCNPNEVGNYCIVGHNYRNTKFFSKVPTLKNGDTIEVTDMSGRVISYAIYDKYTVLPEDTRCTSQLTGGKKEVTLITCTDDSSQRVVVKAREV